MFKTILLILAFVFSSSFALAAVENYQPLAPLEGLTSGEGVPVGSATDSGGEGLGMYVRHLYTWGVALTSGLAVLVIMWGGVGYMTSAGGGGIEEAKGRIQAAIMGLLLALGSYIILRTINQDLVEINFDLENLNLKVSQSNPGTFVPGTGNGGQTPGGGTIGKELAAAWGYPGAVNMQGQIINGRQTYYASGETHSDSNTDAGLGSFGALVEGTPTRVGSAASVYYPPGTLVQINGIKYVVDDNNLVKQGNGTYVPANNVLTNNYTVDIYTTNVSHANSQTTNYQMTVLYVPSTPANGKEVNNIRNNPDKYIYKDPGTNPNDPGNYE